MDFQLFEEKTLKIKIKKTTLALDPVSKVAKFDADAVLLLDQDSDISRINNPRVIINGTGEYEVSGLKISAIKIEDDILYELSSDNVNILLAKVSCLDKISSDKLDDYKVVVLKADEELNPSKITAIEPKLVILYGEKAKEGAKALGKEDAQKSPKISVSEDKLSEELDVMLLG